MIQKKYLFLVVIFFLLTTNAWSITLDKGKSVDFSARFITTNSFRTVDPKGYTYPAMEAGSLVQQRNFLQMVLDIELDDLPNGWGGKCHLVPQGFYDSIYDSGPKEYQDVKDSDIRAFEEFEKDFDLREGYLDLYKGSLFLRMGRQNLSWGEIDGGLTIMDRTNPMDASKGLMLETDEMRMPIGMIRGVYDMGDAGIFSALSVEAYFAPEDIIAPIAPYGSQYGFPMLAVDEMINDALAPLLPVVDFLNFVNVLDVDMNELEFAMPEVVPDALKDSRMGIKLGWMMGELGVSLMHMQAWPAQPTAILRYDMTDALMGGSIPKKFNIEQTYEAYQITGMGLNYYEPHLDCVFRAEVGWAWDEPVSVPDINQPLPVIDDSFTINELSNMDFEDGKMVYDDVLRVGLGVDKNFWARFINPSANFTMFFNWVGEFHQDRDLNYELPITDPSTGENIKNYPEEHYFTLILQTQYLSGLLTARVLSAYDVRGENILAVPQVEYIFNNFRFRVQYTYIGGDSLHGFGIFRDRDQIAFVISYFFE